MRKVTLVLKKETAKKEFLHDTLMMTYTHLMETAAKLGDVERDLKRRRRKAHKKKKFDSRTINTLKRKLLAEQDVNSSLKKASLDGQVARESEANKASEKMKAAKSYIEHLHDDLKAEKQRTKEAEQACLEKDNDINEAKLRQQYSDYRLIAVRGKLSEATKSIELLGEELKSQQINLEAAESQVQLLTDKLETAEKFLHTLQVEQSMLKAQMDENQKQSQANLAAGLQDLKAELRLEIDAQAAKNSVTEKKCAELEQELTTEQKAKAVSAKVIEAYRQGEKVACDAAQQKEQEHEQEVKDIKAAEKAQRDDLSVQVASLRKRLQKELADAGEHNSATQEQHKSELEALRSELTAAESQNQDLEGKLKAARNEASEFEEKYSKAAADGISSQTALAAPKQETRIQTDKCLTLSAEKTAAEKRCATLESRIETIEAVMKQQQQDTNTKLVAEHKEQLDLKTQDVKRLQKQTKNLQESLRSANAQMNLKEVETSRVRVEQAKLTEKSLKIHQDQIDEAKSEAKILEVQLADCQQQLSLAVQEKDIAVIKYDVLLEETNAERDNGVREWNELVDEAKAVITERFGEERCEDLEDLWVSHATSASDFEALHDHESDDEEELDDAEDDTSSGAQSTDSGYTDDSPREKAKKNGKRSGKDKQHRRKLAALYRQIDEVLALDPRRTMGSVDPTEQQPDMATTSRP